MRTKHLQQQRKSIPLQCTPFKRVQTGIRNSTGYLSFVKQSQTIKTHSFSNDRILQDIMTLYCKDGFDLDCTYSKGVFYKSGLVPEPKYKSDLKPLYKDVVKASSENLPFSDQSLSSILFDPPFILGENKKGNSKMINRFSSFHTIQELWFFYYNSMLEFYRILKPGGVVIIKCQDLCYAGKQHFSHNKIMSDAVEIGFYPKDLFILLTNNRMLGNYDRQLHARKYHSYFWVFTKEKCKVDYSI